jgi:hypothetical protein
MNRPARVAGWIVAGDGGAREDELALCLSPIDLVPDLIPDVRLRLPLVDQPGRRAGEEKARVRSERLARGGPVDADLAARGVTAGLRLANGARLLQQLQTVICSPSDYSQESRAARQTGEGWRARQDSTARVP